MVTLDLHVHTFYSSCSLLSFREILEECKKKGIGGVAITDHNRIDGALRFRKESSFPTIVGEEIATDKGEITGLFLESPVPKGMSLEKTASAIKNQGGLVYLPHPLDWTRKGLHWSGIEEIRAKIDVVESFNSRTWLPGIERQMTDFAADNALPCVAASDAHTSWEVGKGLIEVERFPRSGEDFLELLRKRKILRKERSPYFRRTFDTWRAKLVHRLGSLPKLHQFGSVPPA
jgi:predicted metal-dependent phosphoesterase TrpH